MATRQFLCTACGAELHKCRCQCSSMFVAGTERLCELLKFCLATAERELIISSPWVTDTAVQTMVDDLEREARRISIHIYTDDDSNREERIWRGHAAQIDNQGDRARFKKQFEKSVRKLRGLGVSIHQLRNVHNKSLVVDDKLFVDGSFNWLSAWRTPDAPLIRHDSALVITGQQAHRHRCEYLDAQYQIEIEHDPIYLDDTDRDNDVMDFLDLDSSIVRFPRNKDEPTISRSLTLPKSQPLFFAVSEREKNKVARRGIDEAILELNGGCIPLVRTEAFQIEDGLVLGRPRDEFEDGKRFVVFRVDRTKLELDLKITGTFSRQVPLRDHRSPLQTENIIPPDALYLLPTVFERE